MYIKLKISTLSHFLFETNPDSSIRGLAQLRSIICMGRLISRSPILDRMARLSPKPYFTDKDLCDSIRSNKYDDRTVDSFNFYPVILVTLYQSCIPMKYASRRLVDEE